jgi:hypothetical protein
MSFKLSYSHEMSPSQRSQKMPRVRLWKEKERQLMSQERELMSLKLDGMMEYQILNHWRQYEPGRVEALLSQGILKQALTAKANALLEEQMALEKTEGLDPALAELEAWSRLMRPETEEPDEEEAAL